MTKQLHPTLKACRCSFIGTRAQLYKHLAETAWDFDKPSDFFAHHGESVLNTDDPRLKLSEAAMPPSVHSV